MLIQGSVFQILPFFPNMRSEVRGSKRKSSSSDPAGPKVALHLPHQQSSSLSHSFHLIPKAQATPGAAAKVQLEQVHATFPLFPGRGHISCALRAAVLPGQGISCSPCPALPPGDRHCACWLHGTAFPPSTSPYSFTALQ